MATERDLRSDSYNAPVRGYSQAVERIYELLRAAGRFWPLLIAPLMLLSLLDRFPYPFGGSLYSDLAITHYPNAQFLLWSLQEWGQIPLWSPTILGGYPFAANPLSGLWYPPGWLALLFPLPFGFNLVAAAHLLWGGVGMYKLLRLYGLGHGASLLGALAFEAMPKLFGHYGAGHLTLFYAVPWTPWLLWAWKSSLNGEKWIRRRLIGDLTPGVVLGIVFLADVRWFVFAGMLLWSWALAHRQLKYLPITLFRLSGQTLLAFFLAAPLAFPLFEFTWLSSRASLTAQEALALSLPVERLLGLFIPGIQGYHEWMVYPGAVILTLALVTWVTRGMESRSSAWFWTVTVVFGVFVSLGSQLPFMDLLAGLPWIGLLRVPSRAMFLSGFAFAVLAAIGLDRLLRGLAAVEVRRVKGVLVGLVGVFFGLALATGWLAGGIPKGLAWGALAFLSIGGWIWTRERVSNRFSPGMWLAGLLLVACVDLGGIDLQAIDSRRFESVISEGEAAAAYISAQPGKFRVYSPSYSIPQQTAAIYRLELVDGVDPLQVESLTGFMEEASGVPRVGYSVTVPSFATGSPEVDNQAYRPDPKKLGLLNVGYVAAEYDLPVEGLVLRARFGDTRVYENAYSRPRAWVQMEGEGTTSAIEPAESLVWTPNEISVTAAGPGMLVLSEIAYPGWQARVDGVGQEIQVVEGLLRGVRLDPGTNKVVFTYRPYSLYLGLGLLLAAIFFLVYRRFLRINLRRSGPQEVET